MPSAAFPIGAKFEVYRENDDCEGPDSPGDWRWRIRAKNGEIIAAAPEGYKNAPDMTKAVWRYVAVHWTQAAAFGKALQLAGLTLRGTVRKVKTVR